MLMCLYGSCAERQIDFSFVITGGGGLGTHLLIQGFVVLEQRFEGFEHLHLAGHSGRGLGLPLHHRHPQRALVTGHQALQMLQKKLTEGTRDREDRGRKTEAEREREREEQKKNRPRGRNYK